MPHVELGAGVPVGFATLVALAALVNAGRGKTLTHGRSDGILATALKKNGENLPLSSCSCVAFGTCRDLGSNASKILPTPLYLQDPAAGDKDAAVVFFL